MPPFRIEYRKATVNCPHESWDVVDRRGIVVCSCSDITWAKTILTALNCTNPTELIGQQFQEKKTHRIPAEVGCPKCKAEPGKPCIAPASYGIPSHAKLGFCAERVYEAEKLNC